MKNIALSLVFLSLVACSTNIDEVNALTNDEIVKIEEANNVKILYSDSAQVKVRIIADKMIRHLDKANPRDEFPDGIYIEFLNENGQPYSWLEADRATRFDKKKEFVAEGNAKFYNKNKDMLTSTELIWNEDDAQLSTNKFVRISQPSKGDTSLGFGFTANEEFTVFEILRKTSAIFNAENFQNP